MDVDFKRRLTGAAAINNLNDSKLKTDHKLLDLKVMSQNIKFLKNLPPLVLGLAESGFAGKGSFVLGVTLDLKLRLDGLRMENFLSSGGGFTVFDGFILGVFTATGTDLDFASNFFGLASDVPETEVFFSIVPAFS